MDHGPVRAILVGAGQRGADVYGAYALRNPGQLKFVALAEPDQHRRDRFRRAHQIESSACASSWEQLLAGGVTAEAVFICTQDQQHTAPTTAALQAGYHVLLEKPMATNAEDCQRLVEAARQHQRQLHVAHVLRYTLHFQTMRLILTSGVLGQLVHIAHAENVSWWHMAHSYVRGNWRNQAESAPMILAKCCHDLDILLWLLQEPCTRLHSSGGLRHFRSENAPPGAPERCLDGCPAADSCPFYAPFIYQELAPLWRSLRDSSQSTLYRRLFDLRLQSPALIQTLAPIVPDLRQLSDYQGWPVSVVSQPTSAEALRKALETGPYGRCVYHCDNDVVDHQVVEMTFASGTTATLTMHGFSHLEGRTTRIQGALGELQAFLGQGGGWIEVTEHRSGRRQRYDTGTDPTRSHGGGDDGLMEAFVSSLKGSGDGPARTLADQALASHMLAFSAERSRLEQRVVLDPASYGLAPASSAS